MTALRVPFAVGSGGLLSLALFWLLLLLVSKQIDIVALVDPVRIVFTRQIAPTLPENQRTPKPERTAPPELMRPPDIGVGDPHAVTPVQYVPPVITPTAGGPTQSLGPDRDATPMVRIAPTYPPGALAQEIEGWVQVQFNIAASGAVEDPLVVAAEPRNVFDNAALKAIARWRYQPRIVDGTAVERVGVQTVIRFELEQE